MERMNESQLERVMRVGALRILAGMSVGVHIEHRSMPHCDGKTSENWIGVHPKMSESGYLRSKGRQWWMLRIAQKHIHS